ncbi:MAG: hypothetical protein JST78_09635 [Bacteroidetes bacterium]|nr:hypothetical protein [Bacteroidota bacterium]
MESILLNIQDKITTTVPELLYVDEDWGQLDNYSPNFPVKWPCCLIDVGSATYSNIGQSKTEKPINRQMAEATLVLTIANLKTTNTSASAPAKQKAKAWSIHSIIQKVHEQLHGFRPESNCGALIRSSHRRIRRDDGVQEYEIIYTFGATNV